MNPLDYFVFLVAGVFGALSGYRRDGQSPFVWGVVIAFAIIAVWAAAKLLKVV